MLGVFLYHADSIPPSSWQLMARQFLAAHPRTGPLFEPPTLAPRGSAQSRRVRRDYDPVQASPSLPSSNNLTAVATGFFTENSRSTCS